MVEVTDVYALSTVEDDLQFTLMTPCNVVIENNQLHLTGGLDPDHPVDLKIQFDQKLIPKVETINITDSRLKAAWGDQLYRILLVKSNPGKKGEYKISILN